MIDRRLIQHFDWTLLLAVLLLMVVGLTTLYSAVSLGKPGTIQGIFYRQLSWYGIGLCLMFGILLIDYRKVDAFTYWIYGIVVLLLIAVLVVGKHVAGARRWLSIGPIAFQPSELMKLVIILTLAKYYAKRVNTDGLTLMDLFPVLGMMALPFLLILKQPDLGTGLMILLITGSMTLFAGIRKRVLILITSVGILFMPSAWFVLKEYQRQRIRTFLAPETDPLGTGYHIIQSKIAVGSGQLFGKGYMKGTQNALSFLPEQHTDFIFSVLAEDWGLAGSLLLLMLFLFLIIWCLNIAHSCKDPYGIFLVYGITSLFFWEVVINIAMVLGLLPVVGIPLPFVSYGGTAVLVMMVSVGILANISMRKYLFEG